MIYVATVHFESSKWIDIQLRYLKLNITEPFRTFAVLNDIPEELHSRFDTVIPARGDHAGKLNLLAAEIVDVAHPDDILLFVDGDAFPIADPMPTIYKGLSNTSLVAVRRDENGGDRQPHPCFCAVRVSEWVRLRGDWSPGSVWVNDSGNSVTDPGANLLASLERTGSAWTPLLRSNVWNPDPVWFGIYGDIAYHHGAGFRKGRRSRADLESVPVSNRGESLPGLGRVANRLNLRRRRRALRDVIRRSKELSEHWYQRIQADPDFFRPLLAPEPQSAASPSGSAGSDRSLRPVSPAGD